MSDKDNYYYVTAATGEAFITNFAQYAVRSLIKTGVPRKNIHLAINASDNKSKVKKLIPKGIHIHTIQEDVSYVVWALSKGKRRYSLFKAAALHKLFPEPIPNKYMIYFDGDVLWFKDPTPFFNTKNQKTWFHHGKGLDKRAKIKKEDVDIKDIQSLSQWVSEPCAELMVHYGAKVLPDREVVAGLYLLHPRDHAKVLKLTYDGCKRNATKFRDHEGAGDQKPMNAALSVLNTDWHGGSRFFCPEAAEYFEHYFGDAKAKEEFRTKIEELQL